MIGGACAALIYRFLLSAEPPSTTDDIEAKGIKMKTVSAAWSWYWRQSHFTPDQYSIIIFRARLFVKRHNWSVLSLFWKVSDLMSHELYSEILLTGTFTIKGSPLNAAKNPPEKFDFVYIIAFGPVKVLLGFQFFSIVNERFNMKT